MQKVIIVDNKTKLKNGYEKVFLFPALEHPDGVALSIQDILAFSSQVRPCYNSIPRAFLQILGQRFSGVDEATLVPLRLAFVPIINVFLDRFVRLRTLLERTKDSSNLLVGTIADPVTTPTLIEDFRAWGIADFRFNQKTIARLAPVFGLRQVPLEIQDELVVQVVRQKFNANYTDISKAQRPKTLVERLVHRARFEIVTRLSWRFGHNPTFAMGLAWPVLFQHHLYGPGRLVFEANRLVAPPGSQRNNHLRAQVFQLLQEPVKQAFSDFLGEKAQGVSIDLLTDAFLQFCGDYFPTDYLEGLETFQDRVCQALAKYRGNAWFFSDTAFGSVHSFAKGEARRRGLKVIGTQHGGHYGNLKDVIAGDEGELPFYDTFVTWGWTEMERTPATQKVKFLPMPSPWLSERVRQWKTAAAKQPFFDHAAKPFDLLFMANKVYRYPPAPVSGCFCQIDYIRPLAKQLKDLITCVGEHGRRLLIKPYDAGFLTSYKTALEQVKTLEGMAFEVGYYEQKGMTPKLLSLCKIVLWDQPGTGFLECVATWIPTMVLWQRIYTTDDDFSAPYFRELESVGVVHRDVPSLVREVDTFNQDPGAWVNDPRRVAALRAFEEQYARTNPGWKDVWLRFISESNRKKDFSLLPPSGDRANLEPPHWGFEPQKIGD